MQGLDKRLEAPNKEADARFEEVEDHYGVSFQKPNGMGMPYFDFGFEQTPNEHVSKVFAQPAMFGFQLKMIGSNIGVHFFSWIKDVDANMGVNELKVH